MLDRMTSRSTNVRTVKFYSSSCSYTIVNKQLLDGVFVISRIIKVEVKVISRRLRLISLTEVFASSLTASNT